MMEENSSWSGWIIFLIIVVAAVLVYCLYRMGRKDGRPEADDRQPLRRALPDKELAARAGQAWSAYLDLYALGQDCKLARKTLCDEGILYYFQQLCGFFTAGWDEAVLASRIRGVIVDGLRNVLALRLGHDAERGYAFPVRKAAPRMDFNGYLARLGVDLNAPDAAETVARLGSEHDRIRRERDALTTDPNGIYYRRVLDDVLPPLNAFVGDKSLPRLPDAEVIARAACFRDGMTTLLRKHGIECVAFADAAPDRQEDWFIRTPATGMGDMPAIVRAADATVYYKGIVYC